MQLKKHTYKKYKKADQEDEEIHVRVKIKPGVMENAAHADAQVDVNVLHALAIADVLNPAAQRGADLVVTDAGVRYNYTK